MTQHICFGCSVSQTCGIITLFLYKNHTSILLFLCCKCTPVWLRENWSAHKRVCFVIVKCTRVVSTSGIDEEHRAAEGALGVVGWGKASDPTWKTNDKNQQNHLSAGKREGQLVRCRRLAGTTTQLGRGLPNTAQSCSHHSPLREERGVFIIRFLGFRSPGTQADSERM